MRRRKRNPGFRRRGAQTGRKGSSSGLKYFVVIIVLSLLAGYITTQFVIFPVLGMESTVDERFLDKGRSLVERVKDGDLIRFDENIFELFNKDKDSNEDSNDEDSDNDDDGSNGDGNKDDDNNDDDRVMEDGLDSAATGGTPGADSDSEQSSRVAYAVQFGCFSSESAALSLKDMLAADGIKANILSDSGYYKVVGKRYSTKSEAQIAMKKLDKTLYEGIFIAKVDE